MFQYLVNNQNLFYFKVSEDDKSTLGELTSNTNKELFNTKRFVSDGYIDKYIIRSGKISSEFKYESNKASY